MNFFPSRSRHCSECCVRRITVNDREILEYYHRGVVAHLIGMDLALPLDVEMIRPGENEVAAAMRLLERAFQNYPRFFDAVIGDALYLESPFFNFCLDRNKYVVAVLKGNNPALLGDVRGLFAGQEPRVWNRDRQTIRYWHAEGFNSAEKIKTPLRVLHTEEIRNRRRRVAGEWKETTETQSWYWATTLPEKLLSVHQLWQVGHGRWDIENDNFNTLSRDWALDHCFKHDPTAILNFILTLFVAFVLLQSFYRGNLKPELQRIFSTLIALAAEFHGSLGRLRCTAPWLEPRSGFPP